MAKYIAKLKQLNSEDGLGSSGSPAEAARTLLRLSKNGVKAIPKKEATALHRKYFVDCWSPIMVALEAHLNMVHEIVDHLNGLGKKEWWAFDLAGHSTPVPDCSFVDDLMSLTSSLAGLFKESLATSRPVIEYSTLGPLW